jgi:UDP-perosamine 4-acetyltransferase
MVARVIGLGGGGHAKVILEILQLCGDFELVGLLDSNPEMKGCEIFGVSVLGNDTLLPKLVADGITHFFVGVGTIGNSTPRRRLYEMATGLGLQPVNAIHPRAVVSPSVKLGPGVTIMAGAVINASANVGANVIINTGVIIEHDCVLGDHVHVATGARLAGGVSVGEGSHIGIGASVRQSIRIGRNVIVGAGAVVVKDIPDNVVAAGVPARVIRVVQ